MSAANDNTSASSTSTFVTSLVTSLIIFGALMLGFLLCFRRQKRVYQPRSFLVPEKGRSPDLPLSPIGWWKTVMDTPLDTIIRTNGFDAYTFVRFNLLLVKIFIPYFFLTWALLMPLTAISPTQGQTGLNRFTFGNVGTTVQPRYAGHLIALWLLTFWTFWCIYTEVLHYIQARHSYLSSPSHTSTVRSRTVMITKLKPEMMTDKAIRELCSPHAIEKVFLVRDVKEMDDVYDEREDNCTALEKAEGKLLTTASKNIKKGKASAPAQDKVNPEGGDMSLINSIVPIKKRPKHNTGKLPLIGKKADAVEYLTEQIRENTEELTKFRGKLDSYDMASTAIVRFHSQAEAITFAQDRSAHMKKKAPQVYPDISPEDVYWPNLGLKLPVFFGRKVLSWALTIALIIFWAPLVALAGAVANLSTLCSSVSFLSWVCDLPSVVVGIIQGVLPPAVVALLFILLPPILTLFAKIEGIPLFTRIELSVFKRYWLFVLINGFLVITAASGLAPALSQILNSPSGAADIPQTLARTLPQASIYFLTFVVTSGLTLAAKQLSQTITVVVFKIKSLLGASTPRQRFQLDFALANTPFLKIWPDISLLAVLGFVYSCIQPVITLLCLVVFSLYYIGFKYLFVYVYDQPDFKDTIGLFWPRAINHLFVGLYIEEILLAALFFLATNSSGSRSCIPQGVLAVVLGIITIVFHVYITKRLKPTHISLEKFDQTDNNAVEETGGRAYRSKRGHMVRMNTMENGSRVDGHRVGGNPIEHLGNTVEDDLDHGFDPPSTFMDQPVIWIAEDAYGLARLEVAKIEQGKVDASTQGANMDKDGKIHVSRGPPDEEWHGGNNQ